MVDTPYGSSPTSPRARRSSGVNAVPRLSIGVPRTENPRARTRSTGPSAVVRNSNGRSVMAPPAGSATPSSSYPGEGRAKHHSLRVAGGGVSAGCTQKVRMLVNSRMPTAASSRP